MLRASLDQSRNSQFVIILTASCVAVAGGCDPQAGPAYRGQSLLSVAGSVEISGQHQDDLIPALGFMNHGSGELHIVDVEVRGEFPSEFFLDVYVPPPEAVYVRGAEALPDEPQLAVGYIAAVTEDHPDTIRFASGASSGSAGAAVGVCDDQGDCTVTCPDGGCRSGSEWCTGDGEQCYSEELLCPEPDSPPSDCMLTAMGDPALKLEVWEHFAGLSENYMVIYLVEPAPAGSWTAAVLGSAQGLEAGYHLIKVRRLSAAEEEAGNACADQADAAAAAEFNAEHDTDYPLEFLQGPYACTAPRCDRDGQNCVVDPLCSVPEEELEALASDFERLSLLHNLEAGCPLSPVEMTPVEDPASEPVSVRIGANVQPL